MVTPLFARRRSLIVQLTGLIVLPILLTLVGVAYGGVTLHEHAMRDLVGDRDARATRAAAQALTDRFTQRQLTLRVLANRLADGVSLVRLLDEAPELRQVFDGGLVMVDKLGVVREAWQPATDWTASLRSAATPWVLEHDLSIPLVVANASSANQQVILFGGISLTNLNAAEAMGMLRSASQTHFFLVADDRHIIDASTASDLGHVLSDTPVLNGVVPQMSDMTHTDQEDLITVSSHVEVLNWTLVVQESWQNLTSPALRFSLVAPLAMIPAVLLAMSVLVFGVTRIVLPLQRLGRSAARLSWGDYALIGQPVGGVQEIRDLQITLSHMAQRLQQAQSGMHSYIGAVLRGQEDERKRLSRELHDDTLQSLIALDQQRQMAQRALERNPAKAAQHLEQLRTMIEEASQNLRAMLRNLRPSYIEDLGLVPALEMLCTQTRDASALAVHFQAQGVVRRLALTEELSLYRITQEAVTNTLRYAQAKALKITLCFAEQITLTITDDGQGFTVPDRPGLFAQAGHYGLVGMVERAEQMHAQFTLDSTPGNGTRITVQLHERLL